MYVADAWPNEDHSICIALIHPLQRACQEPPDANLVCVKIPL